MTFVASSLIKSIEGNPLHYRNELVVASNTPTDILNVVASSVQPMVVVKFGVSTHVTGVATLLQDTVVIGKCRVTPADANGFLKFEPSLPIVLGATLKLTFCSVAGMPNADVFGYIMGAET